MKKVKLTQGSPYFHIVQGANNGKRRMYETDNNEKVVYIESNSEFKLEIFNPTYEEMGVSIQFNNDKQSGLLILNPGERVFLDRMLDKQQKLLFDTYFIENSDEAKGATQKNGIIKMEFFKPQRPDNLVLGNITTSSAPFNIPSTGSGAYYPKDIFYTSHSDLINTGMPTLDGCITANSTFMAQNSMLDIEFPEILKKETKSIENKTRELETGRIKEGAKSNQDFNTVSFIAESIAFHSQEIQLLPNSQNVKAKKYCLKCDAKIKSKKWKSCPICGTVI